MLHTNTHILVQVTEMCFLCYSIQTILSVHECVIDGVLQSFCSEYVNFVIRNKFAACCANVCALRHFFGLCPQAKLKM